MRRLMCYICTGLRERLNEMLIREGRMELAQSCFDFLAHTGRARSRRLARQRYFCPFLGWDLITERRNAFFLRRRLFGACCMA